MACGSVSSLSAFAPTPLSKRAFPSIPTKAAFWTPRLALSRASARAASASSAIHQTAISARPSASRWTISPRRSCCYNPTASPLFPTPCTPRFFFIIHSSDPVNFQDIRGLHLLLQKNGYSVGVGEFCDVGRDSSALRLAEQLLQVHHAAGNLHQHAALRHLLRHHNPAGSGAQRVVFDHYRHAACFDEVLRDSRAFFRGVFIDRRCSSRRWSRLSGL